jgi:hypothetical protein
VGGVSGLFKSIKKKITLKGAIKTVAGVAGAIPIIGGVIQTVANVVTSSKGQVTAAAAAAQNTAAQQLQSAAAGNSGTFATAPTGPQPEVPIAMQASELAKNPLTWAVAALAALFLLKRR